MFDEKKKKNLEARQDFVDPDLPAANKQQQHLQSQEDSQGQVSTLSSFLQSCIKLLRNKNALNYKKLFRLVNLIKVLIVKELLVELQELEER